MVALEGVDHDDEVVGGERQHQILHTDLWRKIKLYEPDFSCCSAADISI
jgi:hypothetical protein